MITIKKRKYVFFAVIGGKVRGAGIAKGRGMEEGGKCAAKGKEEVWEGWEEGRLKGPDRENKETERDVGVKRMITSPPHPRKG